MIGWFKQKLHQKKVADQMQKHMATATGPSLYKGVIAVAMAALDDDLFQEELSRVPSDQRDVFTMVYECLVIWAILRGCVFAGMPERVRADILSAMRDHFAHNTSWYAPEEFQRLWDKTQEWMPELAKPSKDGNLWPAAALVQIPHVAGSRLDFIPGMAFGYHVINTIDSMTDIGKFTAQQELLQRAPKQDSVLEATLKAGSTLIISGYRRIAAIHGCAPSITTSDEKIIEVYSRVCTAFREASEQRGEVIPAVFLNRVALKFLQVHEKFPEHFFEEHLRYEVDKYLAQGLRPEYRKELPLF